MAKSQGGLGRDYYSIFDDNTFEDKKGAAEFIRISDIEPQSNQPRKVFEREALEKLAESIAVYGVLQPIIVKENAEAPSTYVIIAGERRWRAAKMAGLSEIPAVIFDGDDLKSAQVSLIENIQREDLDPVDEAMAYRTLIERFELTQDQLSKQIGKSRPAITNSMRLLELPDEVLKMLRDNDITQGHARALLGLDDQERIFMLAEKIVKLKLSVRETENAVKKINESVEKEPVVEDFATTQRRVHFKELERKSMEKLGYKVKITDNAKKKSIEISYTNSDDLEDILISLCGKDFFDA